jgi:glycerophosphoryl diester phosphodiesterase
MSTNSTWVRLLDNKSSIFSGHRRPLIFGHRGVPEEYQENTMSGFRRAIELGLDGIELDIFLTRDKKLVVFHDINIERLTGERGLVNEMTWDQLRELDIKQAIDVGDRIIDYGKTEKISLLEDVLEEIRGKLIPIIEIKSYEFDYRQRHTGTELAKLLHRMGLTKNVAVTSYNFWPLLYLERTCPHINSGFTCSPDMVPGGSLRHHLMESSLLGKLIGSTFTNMGLNMFDENTIEKVHQRGLAIGAWTIFSQDRKWLGVWLNEEKEMQYIRNLSGRGIDYFITDNPIRLRNIINGFYVPEPGKTTT